MQLSFSQEVPHPLNNYGVYDFIDELANDQIISVNSAIKPYSRLFIAKCLKEADEQREKLSVKATEGAGFLYQGFWEGDGGKASGVGRRASGGRSFKCAMVQRYNGTVVQWKERAGGKERSDAVPR